jgi:hypothetical protein
MVPEPKSSNTGFSLVNSLETSSIDVPFSTIGNGLPLLL